jgi:transposase
MWNRENRVEKCFVIPVENRNASTMHEIIKKYVEPDSIIYTDCWKAYIIPSNVFGFNYFTVNYSKEFKTP